MTQLCMNRRESKRHATALRLQQCAVQLTREHGFDGWTMDDLATAADVSRRTVFNYFDAKADVVLGPPVALDPSRIAAFVAGGPTGVLLADVLELAGDVIEEHGGDQDDLGLDRNTILGDARLFKLVHDRFEEVTATFVELMREREGDAFSSFRARLIGRLVVSFFENAAERAEADPDRPFKEHFDAAVADARSLLTVADARSLLT